MIAPLEHSTKGLPALEPNVWNEVEKFMKGIVKMNYKNGGCGTVFMETNVNMGKGRHTVLEAFRVDARKSRRVITTCNLQWVQSLVPLLRGISRKP